MQRTEDVLKYARKKADDLERGMVYNRGSGFGGYWEPEPGIELPTLQARGASALEFFRQYAGSDSKWTTHANETYISKGNNTSEASGVRALSPLLREWADQVEAGIIEIAGAQSRAEIAVVSSDVMGQVRMLLTERDVHPAAPIVLCGAALEVALRALADVHNVTVPPPTSLSKLSNALRAKDILTKQDQKELEMCGGLRNDAAHGNFANLDRTRAGLMEQQTTLLLRRIADLHP